MKRIWILAAAGSLAALGGCPTTDERNAFLRYTEDFGTSSGRDGDDDGGGGGEAAEQTFRRTMTLTLINAFTPFGVNPEGDLNVSFAAWVNTSSIRSADQQDALIANGYVQLSSEARLGNVYTLPPGTFVFNGAGVAGATRVTLQSPEAGGQTETSFTFITPDVLLLFEAPPTSCESRGFSFTDDGFPLNAETTGQFIDASGAPIEAETSATDALGIHTLAQYDAYQCEPFRPGLFLRLGGGTPEPNEFFEGENIAVLYSSQPVDGFYAFVGFFE